MFVVLAVYTIYLIGIRGCVTVLSQVDVEDDDDDFNKTEIASCERSITLPYGKEVLQIAKEEGQALESALVRVFSEEVPGLTVREAGASLC